jgi:glucose/arabinose dehydrogenase
MRLRFKRPAAITPALIAAGLSLLGAALSPQAARAQDLYVSSVGTAGELGTENIVVFNGATGEFKDVLTYGRDFSGLAFGPDNNLYANRNSGHTAFDPATGAVVRDYTGAGGGGDLTFGPDGNFYVGNFRAVRKIDRVTGATTTFTSGGNLGNLGALTFGPDGNLYVAAGDAFNIQRFNGTTGAFINNFATSIFAFGLAFGSDNNLYVSTGSNNSVLRLNGTTGALLGTFVAAGSGGLNGARDLAFGPDGNLYVASFQTDSVLRYNGTTGAFLGVFAQGGGLNNPSWLTFGPASNGGGNPPPPPPPSGGNVVPEPGTVALLATGVLPIVGLVRRRRKASVA